MDRWIMDLGIVWILSLSTHPKRTKRTTELLYVQRTQPDGNAREMRRRMQSAPSAGQPSTVRIGLADGEAIGAGGGDAGGPPAALPPTAPDHDDRLNYALLLALYTLQGIPMGLSASIP